MVIAPELAAFLSPAAGEPVTWACTFQPRGMTSGFGVAWHWMRRWLGKGGLTSQLGIGNTLAVTDTRVLLWRQLGEQLTLIGDWPRSKVTGTAVRKHLTAVEYGLGPVSWRDHEWWVFRTKLNTPDGPISLELPQKRGGAEMLQLLGVKVPAEKQTPWWGWE